MLGQGGILLSIHVVVVAHGPRIRAGDGGDTRKSRERKGVRTGYDFPASTGEVRAIGATRLRCGSGSCQLQQDNSQYAKNDATPGILLEQDPGSVYRRPPVC